MVGIQQRQRHFFVHTFGNFQHQASVFELIEGWSDETGVTQNKHHCYVFKSLLLASVREASLSSANSLTFSRGH